MELLIAIFEAYGAYLWLLLLVVMLLATLWLSVLHRRVGQLRRTYAALLTGADDQDLGELLGMYVEQMQLAASKAEQLSRSSDRMEIKVRKSMQRLGLVRFNAFEGIGGEQSFAIALLDEAGDGFVLSSLQGRDESRLYAKPITKWDSTYTLSVEENQAIARAHESDVDKKSQL
ncbi:MAG TPA: DUF4446 family protein [Anaerolineae bacterium]|nr:DUF4446 family protein [Anaerolineae bacterium]